MATLATGTARAQSTGFERWVITFRPKAIARGVSEATYMRAMSGVKPDTAVYALVARQDEFAEELWQYLNRRVCGFEPATSAPNNTLRCLPASNRITASTAS
jgi:membrane-bound lytic murein transglycosylase B